VIPWFRILETVLGLTDLARGRQQHQASSLEPAGRAGLGAGALEAGLAGIVVAALKEVFNRDAHRLELEREQLERERERADRRLKIELLRQTGDRELGRLRLLSGVATASWLGTLVAALFSGRMSGAGVAARVLLGSGWVMLPTALALSLVAQSRVVNVLARLDREVDGRVLGGVRSDDLISGGGVALVPWLIVIGLAVIGVAALVA
jgi:hypothetical protein